MLTQLSTIKARLGISPGDTTQDALLTKAIEAMSTRFDQECNRTFARTVGALQEFSAEQVEVCLACYPVETVTKLEVKGDETEGWAEVAEGGFIVRGGCVLSLSGALGSTWEVGRVTYTGGYVLPGTEVGAGQTALPADLEQAAVEQVAAWYQNKDKLGLIRHWPSSGTYLVLSQLPLLPQVAAVIRPHRRWSL
jgi:hypothetical protein